MRSKPWTLTVDPAGDIIVAGPWAPNDPSSTELFVAKLNSGGTILWQRRLDRKNSEIFMNGGSVEADEPLRDSVSPLAFDPQPTLHDQQPRGGRPRFFGMALVAAGLVAVAAVGAASQDTRALRAFPPVAAASVASKVSSAELPQASAEEVSVDEEAAAELPVIHEEAVLAGASMSEAAAAMPPEPEPAPQLTSAELRTQTISMLIAQQYAEALIMAREYVGADPDDAFAYLCLGAALQDLGRMTEAREAYNECVRHATRGDVAECRALGGRK